MNRPLVATAAVIVALPLAWLAGEQHRSNCINEGRAGCSVLPWDAGHARASAAAPTPAELREAEHLLSQGR